ncbi:MAG: cytochrome c-type biogenesis protein CcmH [Acidobacteriota bacterium]
MPRLRSSLLALALGLAGLLQGASPLANPHVRRLGEELKCLCGCGSTITSCNMLHCHFSDPAREKLLSMVNTGMSDADIMAAFVKEHGTLVLLKPPAEGFNLMGWIMPFAALAAGLCFTWWIMQRFRRKPASAMGPDQNGAVLARYQQRIDKDLENLD